MVDCKCYLYAVSHLRLTNFISRRLNGYICCTCRGLLALLVWRAHIMWKFASLIQRVVSNVIPWFHLSTLQLCHLCFRYSSTLPRSSKLTQDWLMYLFDDQLNDYKEWNKCRVKQTMLYKDSYYPESINASNVFLSLTGLLPKWAKLQYSFDVRQLNFNNHWGIATSGLVPII